MEYGCHRHVLRFIVRSQVDILWHQHRSIDRLAICDMVVLCVIGFFNQFRRHADFDSLRDKYINLARRAQGTLYYIYIMIHSCLLYCQSHVWIW